MGGYPHKMALIFYPYTEISYRDFPHLNPSKDTPTALP